MYAYFDRDGTINSKVWDERKNSIITRCCGWRARFRQGCLLLLVVFACCTIVLLNAVLDHVRAWGPPSPVLSSGRHLGALQLIALERSKFPLIGQSHSTNNPWKISPETSIVSNDKIIPPIRIKQLGTYTTTYSFVRFDESWCNVASPSLLGGGDYLNMWLLAIISRVLCPTLYIYYFADIYTRYIIYYVYIACIVLSFI